MKKQIEEMQNLAENKKITIPTESKPKKKIFSLPANLGGFGDLIPTEDNKYSEIR